MEWCGSGVLTPTLAPAEVSLGSDGSGAPADPSEELFEGTRQERQTSGGSGGASPDVSGDGGPVIRRGVPAVRKPTACQVPGCGERIEPGPSGRSYCYRYRCVARALPAERSQPRLRRALTLLPLVLKCARSVCEAHLRSERVQLQTGAPMRFCQKCSRFQVLSEVRPFRHAHPRRSLRILGL